MKSILNLILLSIAILLTALGLGGIHRNSNTPAFAHSIAVVGGIPVSISEFAFHCDQGSSFADSTDSRQQRLREITTRKALAARAIELRLDRDPEIIRAFENLLAGKLRSLQLEPVVRSCNVTQAEIEKFYQEHLSEFSLPGSVQVAILSCEKSKSAEQVTNCTRRLSEARLEAAKLPAESGFGHLAIKLSAYAATRYKGGILDPLHEHLEYDPFRSAIRELSVGLLPGEVSQIKETDNHLILVRLLSRTIASVKPLHLVQQSIRRKLLDHHRAQLEGEFTSRILSDADISINEALLFSLKLPSHELPNPAVPVR